MSESTIQFHDFQEEGAHERFEGLRLPLARFLETHLDEYGDTERDILSCLDYASSPEAGKGGYVLVTLEEDEIIGAVVLNRTGMSGYIPENILVYIAVHQEHRGRGLGKTLMTHTLQEVPGSIALHVEADNPARRLYEAFGFTNPYLEMRLQR